MGILDEFKSLIPALETAGMPILSTLFTAAISPYTGPFAPLIVSAAVGLVPVINKALGIAEDAPADQTAAKIMSDPVDAQSKLASVQEDHQYTLDLVKQANDYQLQSQAQQVGLNTIESQNPSAFIGGWRPALSWMLVAALGFYVFLPYVAWFFQQFGLNITAPPPIDAMVVGLLCAVLGVNSVARTTEKATGVDTPHFGGTKITTKSK